MSNFDFEVIGDACSLVRENPSSFAASGAYLDREYSEAAFRTRDRVLSRTRLRRARPVLAAAGRLPRGSCERQDECDRVAAIRRTAPPSVMARMAAAMRLLIQRPDDALDTEWAKAVLLLTFLVWDDSSDAPEWRFCEFGRLPYQIADGAGSFEHRSGLKRFVGTGWAAVVLTALRLVQPSRRLAVQQTEVRIPAPVDTNAPSDSSGPSLVVATDERVASRGPVTASNPNETWSVELSRDKRRGRFRSATVRWRSPKTGESVEARVRGRSRVALLVMVVSEPDQELSWSELQVTGLARSYWAMADPDSLRRIGSEVRKQLGPALCGYWNQSSHGIRWSSPPGFESMRHLPDAVAHDR